MLVFSTKLPLKKDSKRSEWVALFIDWVVDSPRYPFSREDFDNFSCDGHSPIEIVKDCYTFSITFYKDDVVTLAACKLETRNPGELWITQNVAYEEHGRKYLLVQTHCIKKEYIGKLPKPKTPFTVKLFIRNKMCDLDGVFPITDTPLQMCDQYIEPCAEAMHGLGEGIMPIVYISSYYWPTEISVRDLARDLQGIAHVIEEPDSDISLKLREASCDANVYGGYIGVYFPGHTYRRKFADHFYPAGTAKVEMAHDIKDTIRNALLNKADATKYSWEHIMSLQHKQKVGKLQVDTATLEELREWYTTFNTENDRLSTELQEAKSTTTKLYEENQRLAEIIEGYQTNTCTERTALLQLGNEHDLYPCEQHDIVLDVLNASLSILGDNTRPYHIVQSILDANPKKGMGTTIEKTVKQVFKGKGDISNANSQRALSSVGFRVTKGKNHLDITFGEDNRYNFTSAATPSNHRSGNNIASEICKKLFVRSK